MSDILSSVKYTMLSDINEKFSMKLINAEPSGNMVFLFRDRSEYRIRLTKSNQLSGVPLRVEMHLSLQDQRKFRNGFTNWRNEYTEKHPFRITGPQVTCAFGSEHYSAQFLWDQQESEYDIEIGCTSREFYFPSGDGKKGAVLVLNTVVYNTVSGECLGSRSVEVKIYSNKGSRDREFKKHSNPSLYQQLVGKYNALKQRFTALQGEHQIAQARIRSLEEELARLQQQTQVQYVYPPDYGQYEQYQNFPDQSYPTNQQSGSGDVVIADAYGSADAGGQFYGN